MFIAEQATGKLQLRRSDTSHAAPLGFIELIEPNYKHFAPNGAIPTHLPAPPPLELCRQHLAHPALLRPGTGALRLAT